MSVLCILTCEQKWSFFAVFDGHAGARVSAHCSEHLLGSIMQEEQFKVAGITPLHTTLQHAVHCTITTTVHCISTLHYTIQPDPLTTHYTTPRHTLTTTQHPSLPHSTHTTPHPTPQHPPETRCFLFQVIKFYLMIKMF